MRQTEYKHNSIQYCDGGISHYCKNHPPPKKDGGKGRKKIKTNTLQETVKWISEFSKADGYN